MSLHSISMGLPSQGWQALVSAELHYVVLALHPSDQARGDLRYRGSRLPTQRRASASKPLRVGGVAGTGGMQGL